MSGRHYDEFTVGERVEHEIRRTVTETDNLLITVLTHNPQPLHLDAEYARETEFGRIVVNGIYTFGLMVGLSVGDTTLGTLVANLGYDQVVMPNPVFVGDTLRAETIIADMRESRSRPDAGIVVFEHRALNQRDEIVCSCRRSALIRKASPGKATAMSAATDSQ
ncbi:MAG: MaoC family dehydratase [Caulobacteraceae bacterium]